MPISTLVGYMSRAVLGCRSSQNWRSSWRVPQDRWEGTRHFPRRAERRQEKKVSACIDCFIPAFDVVPCNRNSNRKYYNVYARAEDCVTA